MLHNLKSLVTSRTSQILGANSNHRTHKLMECVFFRSISQYPKGLIRCWQCGNENSSAGVQFKCTKCQSLLELPDDVVRIWTFYWWILNILAKQLEELLCYCFISRITFNYYALINDLISIRKHWQNNSDKFKMYCIPISLVIGNIKKIYLEISFLLGLNLIVEF